MVPAELKSKCFEILLTNLLTSTGLSQKETIGERKDDQQTQSNYKIPPSVVAFMRKCGITQEEIYSLIMIANDEVHFIKEPDHGAALRGQNEWALLVALKNGLLNNTMKADPEDVRSMVQDKGYYNQANFAKYFKTPKYAKYFKSPLESQGSPQQLTREGENALAELIKALVNK